jgi:hypothetical protein
VGIHSLPETKTIEVDKSKFMLHKRIGEFAIQVYDASMAPTKLLQAKAFGLDSEDDLLYTWFTDNFDSDHCPKFAVLLDHKTQSVVLVLRGTLSIHDIIIDIVCDDTEFLDGHAHRGILGGSLKVISESGPVLKKALELNPGYRLMITGHSLGAGTAVLVAMEFLMGKNKQGHLPPSTNIGCVALAPPPIYRSEKEVPLHVRENINIYINGQVRARQCKVIYFYLTNTMLSFFQDCVPRLSLASVARLMSMARAVAALKLTVYQQMQVFAARLSGDMIPEITANLKKVQEAIKDIDQDRFPFLEHPGQIHYLFSINGGNGGTTNNVPYNVTSSFSFQNTVRNSIFWSMSLHTHSLVTFFFWTKW